MSANMCMHIHMFFWARTAQSIVFLQCQLRGGGVSSKTFRCRRAHRRPCPLPPPPGRPPPSPSHIRALIHPYPVPLCKTIPLDPLSRVRLYIPLYPMKLKVARAVGCVDTVMYRARWRVGGTSRPSTHALCSSAENKTGRRTFLAFARLYLRTFGPHRTPLALEDLAPRR